MELDPRDHDIVRLLTGLKIAASEYPPDLLAARRQTYIRRVAEIGAGLGVATELKNAVKKGRR